MWAETKAIFFVLTVFGVDPTGMPSTHSTIFETKEDCEQVGDRVTLLAEEQEWGSAFFICFETPEVIVEVPNA